MQFDQMLEGEKMDLKICGEDLMVRVCLLEGSDIFVMDFLFLRCEAGAYGHENGCTPLSGSFMPCCAPALF